MRAHLIIAAVVSALTLTSASATVIISDDIGGKMQDYTARFRQVRELRRVRRYRRYMRFGLHNGARTGSERPNLRHP